MFHIGTISISDTHLSQLEAMFERKRCKLIIKVGDALTILRSLVSKHNIERIYSHYETWNKFTRNRDKTIREWVAENSVDWIECQQNGVVKNLKCRDGWSTLWHNYMRKKIYEVPKKIHGISEDSDKLPSPQDLNLEFDGFKPNRDFGTTEPEIVLKVFYMNVVKIIRGKCLGLCYPKNLALDFLRILRMELFPSGQYSRELKNKLKKIKVYSVVQREIGKPPTILSKKDFAGIVILSKN